MADTESRPAGTDRPPSRLVRFAPYVLAAAAVLVLVGLRVTGVLLPDHPAYRVLVPVSFLVVNVVGLGYLARAATHPRLSPAERRPWRLIALGMLAAAIGGTAYGASVTTSASPIGALGLVAGYTASRVVMVALVLVALPLLTAVPMDRAGRLRLLFDSGTVLGGGIMVIWYVVAGPVLVDESSTAVRLIAVAWPLLDLLLLAGVCTVIVRGAATSSRGPLLLVLAGLLLILGTDLFQVHRIVNVPDATGTLAGEFVHLGALALIGAAGRERCLQARAGSAAPPRRIAPHPSVTYVALLLGYGILVVAAARSGLYPWPGLVLGAVIITSMTAGRQALALREITALSATDGLTGLANRTPLWDAIARASARSRRTGAPMAVLLADLDEFKPVNDRYGHAAGDAVLVEFAAVLTRCVRGTDFVARLGGDEFALVLEDVTGRRAITVAERVHDEAARPVRLGPDGPEVPIRCSIGIAVGDPLEPGGVPEPAALLQRADRAMYRSKQAGRHGWWLYREDAPPGRPEQEPAR